jgi:ParB-like chromosome segregation protein Spo0J
VAAITNMPDLMAIMARPQSRPDFIDPGDLHHHRMAALVPPMTPGEYRKLKADINDRGLMVPVVLYEGEILDGRHRYRACRELGRGVDFAEYMGDDPVGYVLAVNVHRRHLTQEQRRAAIREALKGDPDKSNRQHAEALGVSHNTVSGVRDELEATGQIDQLDRTTGKDGKTRPTAKPKRRRNKLLCPKQFSASTASSSERRTRSASEPCGGCWRPLSSPPTPHT